MTNKQIQEALNNAGFPVGVADGIFGKRTAQALRNFQQMHKLPVTGIADSATLAVLEKAGVHKTLVAVRAKIEAPGRSAGGNNWPHQRDVQAFYGPPGGAATSAGRCHLAAPMVLAWDLDEKVSSFVCHERVASALTTIFAETVRHYGEAEWRRLRLDRWGGCREVRKMRGGSAYSMHSWGIAVDIDSEHNQLKWNSRRATLAKEAYVPFWNIVESTGAVSLGRARDFDWMHFQFARIG